MASMNSVNVIACRAGIFLSLFLLQESAPTLHKPYTSGSGTSKLMDCLERSHCGKDLSADEKETVALWLDLGVPFCGSYLEGRLWTRAEELRYRHYQDKRLLYAREELEALCRPVRKDPNSSSRKDTVEGMCQR